MRTALLLLLLPLPLFAADKEAARREALFLRAREPVTRQSVSGWLAGDYHLYDPVLGAWRREHALLIGGALGPRKAWRLVFVSWPMKKGAQEPAAASRLAEVKSTLAERAARFAPPVLARREIVFSGDGSDFALRSVGDDLILRVRRSGAAAADAPGWAILTESMEPR